MTRDPKAKPTGQRRLDGNTCKRDYNPHEPLAPGGMPSCPGHFGAAGCAERDRLAAVLYRMAF